MNWATSRLVKPFVPCALCLVPCALCHGALPSQANPEWVNYTPKLNPDNDFYKEDIFFDAATHRLIHAGVQSLPSMRCNFMGFRLRKGKRR